MEPHRREVEDASYAGANQVGGNGLGDGAWNRQNGQVDLSLRNHRFQPRQWLDGGARNLLPDEG